VFAILFLCSLLLLFLVFFHHYHDCATRLDRKVFEMTYFVSSGSQNLNAIAQQYGLIVDESHNVRGATEEAVW